MSPSLRALSLFIVLLAARAAGAPATDSVEPVHFDAALLDTSKDPCTDFYAYTCSRWLAANPVPGDEVWWDTSSPLSIWSRNILRGTLEAAARADAKRSPGERLIGDAWAACMDEPAIEKAGLGPVKADLDRIARLADKRSIAREVARLHLGVPGAFNMGNNGTDAVLFGFGSSQDLDDASTVILMLDQGGTALPGRDYYLGDDPQTKEIREKYLGHLERMFTLAGEKPAVAKASARTVLDMETALARASMDNVRRRDPKNLNNVRTLSQVKQAAPSFDWNAYLAALGAPVPKHYLVATPEFLTAMESLIQKSSVAEWRTYLRWWTLHGQAALLSRAFVE